MKWGVKWNYVRWCFINRFVLKTVVCKEEKEICEIDD